MSQWAGMLAAILLAGIALYALSGFPHFSSPNDLECGVLTYDAALGKVVSVPINLSAPDDTCLLTGNLPLERMTPGSSDVGCLLANGTDFVIGACDGSSIGSIALDDPEAVNGILGAPNGGLGTDALAPGYLKSPGPNLTITSVSTIPITDVTGTAGVTQGGTGVPTFTAGFLKSPGNADPFVTVANIDLTTDVTGTAGVINGGTGTSTFTAGFLKSPGGTDAFVTMAEIDLGMDVIGVLPKANGGFDQSLFTTGYLKYNGTDTVSVFPVPSADIAPVLVDKTLSGSTTILDVGLDALLYIDSGGLLSGVRYEFGEGFTVDTAGTNPTIISVSVANFTVEGGNVTSIVPVAFGGTGQPSLANGIMQVNLGVVSSTLAPVQYGGTGINTYDIGDLLYASGTTALSKLPTGAYGEVLHSDGPGLAPYWSKVNVQSEDQITGVLPAVHGGTGFGAVYVPYTTGDMLYASSSSTLARRPAVATGNVLISQGTSTAPVWGKVSLTAHIDAATILPAVNGGTGIGSFATGDILYASSATLLSKLTVGTAGQVLHTNGVGLAPSWASVVLTSQVTGILPAVNGGTGIDTYATGDILYASSASTLARRPITGVGNVLISGTTPSWGKVGLTSHVDGTLGVFNGGTGNTFYAIGDILYASSFATLGKLPAAATGNVLLSGTTPTWNKVGLTTHVSGVLAAANGGTGHGGTGVLYTIGDILYASATNTLAKLPASTSGRFLRTNGAGTAPSWADVTITGTVDETNGGTGLTAYATGDILYASAPNTLARRPAVATGNVLISGTTPTWNKVGLTTHVNGILPPANGGTGQSSYTNGQLLIGNTAGNTLTKATLTAGTGISITNGAGSITIASTVSILPKWVYIEMYTDPVYGPGNTFDDSSIVRPLNTESLSSGSDCSLYSVAFIQCVAGTYDIEASAPAHASAGHQIFLNTGWPDYINLAWGTLEFTTFNSASPAQTRSFLKTRLTFSTTTIFGISHYTKVGAIGGQGIDYVDHPMRRIFSEMTITKLA